jgi:copper(I)-binding protein
MKHGLLITILLLMSFLSSGCGEEISGITVSNAWANPGVEGGNSAVYFVIENSGDQADTLLKAEATIAEFVEVHESNMDSNGMIKKQKRDRVSAPNNANTPFQPGGLHVMLVNLTQDLKVGDHFDLILSFEQAGQVQVDVEVRQP